MSILSLTQKEFADQMVSYAGKGRRHAERLYQQYMKKGDLSDLSWVEPQAGPLVQKMVEAARLGLVAAQQKLCISR